LTFPRVGRATPRGRS